MPRFLIYHDIGASEISVQSLQHYLQVHKKYSVRLCKGKDLQNPSWLSQTNYLIMPGGRSLPFYAALGDHGNRNIKQFVMQGGCYLGFCAGAYYASKNTIFAKGLPLSLYLKGELNFFQGDAVGPVLNPEKFAYDSETGKIITDIHLPKGNKTYSVYLNGGCSFSQASQAANTEILAWYNDNHQPAIIACKVAQGCAILSGVHPELSDQETCHAIMIMMLNRSVQLCSGFA